MFGDVRPGGSRYERRGGRNIERAAAIATGAASVNHVNRPFSL